MIVKTVVRRALAGLGVAVVATIAAGCFLIPDRNMIVGPFTVRVSEGFVEIAVCADIDVVSISLKSLDTRAPGGEEMQWWQAEGDVAVEAGSVLTTTGAQQLFGGGAFTQPDVAGQVGFFVDFRLPNGTASGAWMEFPGGTPPGSGWVDSFGDVHDEPCPDWPFDFEE